MSSHDYLPSASPLTGTAYVRLQVKQWQVSAHDRGGDHDGDGDYLARRAQPWRRRPRRAQRRLAARRRGHQSQKHRQSELLEGVSLRSRTGHHLSRPTKSCEDQVH